MTLEESARATTTTIETAPSTPHNLTVNDETNLLSPYMKHLDLISKDTEVSELDSVPTTILQQQIKKIRSMQIDILYTRMVSSEVYKSSGLVKRLVLLFQRLIEHLQMINECLVMY